MTNLVMWTVYDNPTDYPGWFVARKWLIVPGEQEPVATGTIVTGRTLEDVRSLLPPELYCIPRTLGDENQIVETWI